MICTKGYIEKAIWDKKPVYLFNIYPIYPIKFLRRHRYVEVEFMNERYEIGASFLYSFAYYTEDKKRGIVNRAKTFFLNVKNIKVLNGGDS